MKQPKLDYVVVKDSSDFDEYLELKANGKLLAEWRIVDSDFNEASFAEFKRIYNDGIDFALRQIREKIMTKETDEQTSEYLDGYADFQREMINALDDYTEEFEGNTFCR